MYDLLKMLMRPLHASFDRRSMSHATAQILGQTKFSPKAAGLGGGAPPEEEVKNRGFHCGYTWVGAIPRQTHH